MIESIEKFCRDQIEVYKNKIKKSKVNLANLKILRYNADKPSIIYGKLFTIKI